MCFFLTVNAVNCLIVLCTCVYWWLSLCSFLLVIYFVVHVIMFVGFVSCCCRLVWGCTHGGFAGGLLCLVVWCDLACGFERFVAVGICWIAVLFGFV